MRHIINVVAVVALLVLTPLPAALTIPALAPPIPHPWPLSFSATFMTNVTSANTKQWIPGVLYYDYARKAQRIDHGSGSYECVEFYNTSGSCSLYFLPASSERATGLYAVLHQEQRCCLDIPGLGTLSPTWLEGIKYSGVQRLEYGSQEPCNVWTAFTGHSYWQRETDDSAAKMTFPKHAMQDYVFGPDGLTPKDLPETLFTLPSGFGNCSEPCSSDTHGLRRSHLTLRLETIADSKKMAST
eukprot:m.54768 g.54768  ORF g.54768 m.54768 type:complete len:242 (-) comp12481_c0_seq3:9-734(-)